MKLMEIHYEQKGSDLPKQERSGTKRPETLP